jgi:predicted phage gp36 major capsid-like protein
MWEALLGEEIRGRQEDTDDHPQGSTTMFEQQMILDRTNEMLARAEHQRLVREAKRANKARRAGERRATGRIGGAGRRSLRAAIR